LELGFEFKPRFQFFQRPGTEILVSQEPHSELDLEILEKINKNKNKKGT
jgi:hypothetical protein